MNLGIQLHHLAVMLLRHGRYKRSPFTDPLLFRNAFRHSKAFLGAEEFIELVKEIRPETSFLVILGYVGLCIIIALLKVLKGFCVLYRSNGISFCI